MVSLCYIPPDQLRFPHIELLLAARLVTAEIPEFKRPVLLGSYFQPSVP